MRLMSKRDELLFLSIVGIIFLSIVLVIQIMNPNYEWSLLLVNCCLLICFVFHDINRYRSVLSYGLLFNVIWWLYTNVYIIEKLIIRTSMSSNDYLLVVLSIISMISFNIAYYYTNYRTGSIVSTTTEVNENKFYNYKKIKYILLAMFIVVLLIEGYVVLYKIGLDNYIFGSRAERSLMLKPLRKFMIYEELLILISILSYFIKLKMPSRLMNLIFYTSFLNSAVIAILSISRTNALMLILPILFIAVYNKRITNKRLIIIMMTLFFLFAAWKGLLYNLIFYRQLNFNFGNFTGEFTTWYTIGDNVLNDLFNNKINYLYGKSFLDTIMNLLIPITNIEPLSVWYVKNYEYETYMRGGGRGFSGIVEAYMNLPVVGNILYFAVLGLLFRKINNLRNVDMKFLIIYSISLPYIQRIFRSESYSLFKTWFWLYVIVVLVIFKVCKVREKKHIGNTREGDF